MALDSLGYFGVRTRNLADWSQFGEKLLGLQLIDRSRKTLTFRMDDRRQRIVVHEDVTGEGQRAAFMGSSFTAPGPASRRRRCHRPRAVSTGLR